IGAIREGAVRATDMLHSVRQLYARHDGERETLDANALVEESVGIARMDLDAAGIGVQLQLQTGLPSMVANRRQLQEVLLNLVQNAVDAMRTVPDHATVLSITTAAGAGKLEIIVADTGTGIDARDADRIFEAFFTTKPNGMGMGLALSRTIVEG